MRPGPDAIATAAAATRRPKRLARLVACEMILLALADWLLWDTRAGLSLPLFAGAVALAAFTGLASAAGPRRLTWSRAAAAALVLVVGLLPLIEDLGLLSLAFGLAGTLMAIEVAASGSAASWPRRLRGAAARPMGGCRRIWRDAALVRRIAGRGNGTASSRFAPLLAYILPVASLAVFLALFASANPIIAGWLADLPRPSWPSVATLIRAAFWTFVLTLTWPLIRAKPSAPEGADGPRPAPGVPSPAKGVAGALLAPAAVLRALAACNLLFAAQIALDGAYLWGGMALPPGVSYASYAHRGAYPLVATALLSAAFVLVAGASGRRSQGPARLIPALALAFTGQNVLLVASSMRRLGLYVDAYGLTELRLAAFLWMLLVATGLALIMVQAALSRSNAWLITRACAATAAMLYACCFLDVPATVAAYDVDHCDEVRGSGPALDSETIVDLGPEALPALDRYLAGPAAGRMRDRLAERRGLWAAEASARAQDWRAWTFRAWRLGRYLDRVGTGPAAARPDDPAAPNPDGSR